MATRAPRGAPSAPSSSSRSSRTGQASGGSRTRASRTASSAGSPRTSSSRAGSSRTGSSRTGSSRNRTSASKSGTASPYRRSRGKSRSRASCGPAAAVGQPGDDPAELAGGGARRDLDGAGCTPWARRPGAPASSARDLDPAHRRDGAGAGGAVRGGLVSAAAIWWHLGLIGKPLTFAAARRVRVRRVDHPHPAGAAGGAVPAPPGPQRGRRPHGDRLDGAAGRRARPGAHRRTARRARRTAGRPCGAAGGVVGYLASAPLVHLVTKWAAAPVLAAVTGFGLLVITGTPLHRVPAGWRTSTGSCRAGRSGRDRPGGGRRWPRKPGPGTQRAASRGKPGGWRPSRPATTRGPTTRRCSAAAGPGAQGGKGGRGSAPGRRRPAEPVPDALSCCGAQPCQPAWCGRLGGGTRLAGVWFGAGGPDAAAAAWRPGPATAAATDQKPEQLTLTGATDASYTLPPSARRPGRRRRPAPPRTPDGPGAVSVLSKSQVDAEVTVHPGATVTRYEIECPSGQGRAGHRVVQEHRVRGEKR